MAISKNPARYADVQQLLDIAAAEGECVVTYKSPKAATSCAHRVNAFQRLMESLDPNSHYVGYVCLRQGDNKSTLRILPRTVESFGGTIETLYDKADIKPQEKGRPNDPLQSVAAMLKAEGLLDE